MPNSIQYNTGTTISSLGVGDMHIGAGGDMGPTSTTGFFNGINPPSGGYTIYLNKGGDDGPSILCPASDAELIGISNQIAGGNDFTTINDCFTYFAPQSDKMVMHNHINTMVTDGLVACFSAGTLPSYPRSGTTWYDLREEDNNGTLKNDTSFDSNGWMEFDGVDDRVSVGNPTSLNFATDMSCEAVFKRNSNAVTNQRLLSKGGGGASTSQNGFSYFGSNTAISFACTNNAVRNIQSATITTDTWYHVVGIIDQTSNKQKVWLNGVLTNSVTLSGTGTMVGTADFNIGMFGNSSLPWDGDIESVRIYGKALTDAEVLQNYYQGAIVTDDLAFAVDAGNLVSYENGDTTTNSLVSTDTGTLTNGVAFSSGNGGTWNFDDVDDYIAFGNPVWSRYIYTDPFSLEVWCKPDTTSGFKHLIGKSYSDYRLAQSGTGISFRLDSNNIATQFGTLVAGEWTHIVATWEPATSTAYVYQDGVLKGSVTDETVNWTSTSNNFQMGTSPGESYYFGGSIAIGRAYSKTLSLAEVGQNYNANINRFN